MRCSSNTNSSVESPFILVVCKLGCHVGWVEQRETQQVIESHTILQVYFDAHKGACHVQIHCFTHGSIVSIR